MSVLNYLRKKAVGLLTNANVSAKIKGMSPDEIKKLRIDLGWSQQKVGEEIGVALTTVLRWEKGYAKPSPMALKQLKQLKARHEGGEI